ncbi:MAG: hypothetical protein VX246_08440 [Myxococcota bacterium]|nr:hypothetical protein [Myxococcota bacterium]
MPDPPEPLAEDPPRGHLQLAAGLALLALLPLAGWLYAPIHRPMDEGLLLVFPDLMLRGLVPFRDFNASYPPGNFFVLAGAYSLAGVDLAVERSIGFAYRALLVMSIILLTWSRGAAIATVCGVACALLLSPLRLDAYSWLGGIALLVAAVAVLDRDDSDPGGANPLIAGLLAGLALTFRIDLIVALSLAFLSQLAGAARGVWLRVAIGCGVGLIPLLVVVVIASPAASWQALVYETIFGWGPNRRLPFSALSPALWREVALVAVGVSAAIGAAVRSLARSGIQSRAARSALSTAALCVGILPQAWQRLDEDHLLYVACLVTALLPASIDRLWPQRWSHRLGVATAALAVLVAAAPFAPLSLQLLQSALRGDRAPEFVRGERSVRVRSVGERDDLASVVAQVDHLTERGDRLLIAPVDLRRTNYCDLSLYHLFPELDPATFYLEMLPGTTNREGSRFAQDLATADVIVSSHRWEGWRQPDGSMLIGSVAPVAVRDAHFEVVGRHGHWVVHARRDREKLPAN